MAFVAVRSLLNVSKISSSNKILLINPVTKSALYNVQNTRTLARSLSVLSSRRVSDRLMPSTTKALLSNACSCGCSLHTKGDKELSAFLAEEIENEMKAQPGELPKLEGFECHLEGAEVTLKKKWNNETISIKSNVNNSVDADESVMDPNDAKEPQESEMKAKPEFTIEIEKGGKILSFLCTYATPMADEVPNEDYNDSFQISEISLHSGEFDDSTYTVSGDIMDGYLYDLLMNYLEERGISNDFAEKLITFFTLYEHKLYVNLLKNDSFQIPEFSLHSGEFDDSTYTVFGDIMDGNIVKIFQISEISLHSGEFDDSTYTVSGNIMDGYLYYLLMNYLEERGISNDFAEKLITFFTLYEHKLYVNLLKSLKSFVEK